MRPSWDSYFLGIAAAVSTRADCTRAQHGAVIVRSNRIVSTGYNGAPAGDQGCASAGACPRGRLDTEQIAHLAGGYDDPQSPNYCIAVHAEANAIAYASRDQYEDGTIYITGEPCAGCRKLIAGAGISRIVWPDSEGRPVVERRQQLWAYNGRIAGWERAR